jgi:2,4-dichlorophenol 6-monooxygenase
VTVQRADRHSGPARDVLQSSARAKKRRAIREAIELKHYEFNAHGVEHNQRYESAAVIPGGTLETISRDGELFGRPTSRPGAKLPHAWLVDDQGRRISTQG